MSSQDPLFHEDWRDAVRHVVKALGGFEAVGVEIWPSKARKAAGIWLSDCLNPERPAKLDLEEIAQILRLGRIAGYHVAINQLCADTGYAEPDIAPKKTEKQKLAEQMQRALDEFKRLADEHAAIDNAETTREMRAVK